MGPGNQIPWNLTLEIPRPKPTNVPIPRPKPRPPTPLAQANGPPDNGNVPVEKGITPAQPSFHCGSGGAHPAFLSR